MVSLYRRHLARCPAPRRGRVTRVLVVCAGVLGVLLLGSPALADIHAVAKPTTQTVPISNAAGAL